MKSIILKCLSLTLVLCMLLSLAACKPKKKDKNKNNSKTESTVSDVIADFETSFPDEFVDDFIADEAEPFPEDDFSDDFSDVQSRPEGTGESNFVVALPNTSGEISTGIKYDYDGGFDEDEFGDEIFEEDFEDIDLGDEVQYEPVIQKYGSAVKGPKNARIITVDNTDKGIAYTNFDSIGCNVYPTQSTFEAQVKNKSSKAYLELQAERFNDIKPCYARTWFQIDWMMTNYAGDDYAKYERDWENNPDYQAYYKGEYDFENELFQSCVDYWSMLGEAGTRVEVSFGWKIATRIQAWFGADPSRQRIAAPRDLEQYADAAKEMFIYLFDKGVTNVDILTFYNEPSRLEDSLYRGSWDYAVLGDKRIYWVKMAEAAKKALKSDKRTEHVELWGVEASEAMNVTSDVNINPYIQMHYPDLLDVVTVHAYYCNGFYNPKKQGSYDVFFNAALETRNFYEGKDLMVTEFYCADRQFTDENCTSDDDRQYVWYNVGGWDSSYASYYIAMANTGWRAMLNWGFVGGYLPDPVGFDPANGLHAAWKHPTGYAEAVKVQYQFYEQSLLNNYVPDDANVHKLTWEGEDIRTSAFTSADGEDTAIVVEKNEGTELLDFNIRLKKSLGGKNVYVYRFTFESSLANTEESIHTTVVPLYDTITKVQKSFTYKEKVAEKGLYTIYVFSTIEPLKQIELYKAGTSFSEQGVVSDISLMAGGKISLEPKFVDCEDSGVTWEIKRYACAAVNKGTKNEEKCVDKVLAGGDLGELTQAGNVATYKLPDDAEAGDIIALRCTLKGTDGKRFAVAMLHVVE